MAVAVAAMSTLSWGSSTCFEKRYMPCKSTAYQMQAIRAWCDKMDILVAKAHGKLKAEILANPKETGERARFLLDDLGHLERQIHELTSRISDMNGTYALQSTLLQRSQSISGCLDAVHLTDIVLFPSFFRLALCDIEC